MAHKKGQGSTRNGRDSNPQYRGVKVYGGQFVPAFHSEVPLQARELGYVFLCSQSEFHVVEFIRLTAAP